MGYKGHPGFSDADVGNVPDKNPMMTCHGCGTEERLQSIEGVWKYKLGEGYEQYIRCPECQDGTEDGTV